MKLSEYIEILRGRLDAFGDIDVRIEEDGYYAGSCFADLYDMPKLEAYEDGVHYLCLGNSEQWP